MSGCNVIWCRARIGDPENAIEREYHGRPAWMLHRLHTNGAAGVTTIETPPGIRVAHFVYLLRRDGIRIESEHETHEGAFRGRHARYRLATPVQILETKTAEA